MLIGYVYNEIIHDSIKNRRNVSETKLSDSKIIKISIVGEALTIDSEKAEFISLKRILQVYFLMFVIEHGLIKLKEIYTK